MGNLNRYCAEGHCSTLSLASSGRRSNKAVGQFPSKEEEQHTFRTTPREHWQILVGVFKARPS